MAAPKCNTYWQDRKKDGRDPEYKPQDLWERACEYFQWCDENPWVKKDFVRGGDSAGSIVDLETSRPYTLTGFCDHARISEKTFGNYHKNEGYVQVTTRIKQIMFTQKFEGAAVGAFNANLIARDLGLADRKEIDKKITKLKFKDAE